MGKPLLADAPLPKTKKTQLKPKSGVQLMIEKPLKKPATRASTPYTHSMRCAGGPEYTKRAHHKTAAGKPYVAQAGTQALDGWWGAAKKSAFGVPAKHPAALNERVRETQWHHWVGDGDRWVAAGEVLSWVPE